MTLSTRRAADYIDVIVADTGVGIPKEDLSKLFRMDVQYSQPGTDGEEGSGLGLFLSKSLIRC